MAQGHGQDQAAAGDAKDGANGSFAADLGHLLDGPIEVLPAEVAHRQQGRLPILGFGDCSRGARSSARQTTAAATGELVSENSRLVWGQRVTIKEGRTIYKQP